MTVTTQPSADQSDRAATDIDAVIRLRPEQVGQHPDNIRGPDGADQDNDPADDENID
jgi:hypothetical protein